MSLKWHMPLDTKWIWSVLEIVRSCHFFFKATHPFQKYLNGRSGEYSLQESQSHSAVSDSLQPHGLYSPWNSPDQNTGVGSRSLLWGIFPTQGSNPSLLHCRQILYQLSHQGSIAYKRKILFWDCPKREVLLIPFLLPPFIADTCCRV